MTDRSFDVIVAGDGPAGAAIAAACAARDLTVAVVGPGDPWTSTYGAWVDDVPAMPDSVWSSVSADVVVGGARLRRVERGYGVFDNAGLRRHLDLDRRLVHDRATALEPAGTGVEVTLSSGEPMTARWVFDARGGAPVDPVAWQTAYGLFVDESVASSVATTDATTLMDWSWSGSVAAPSFLYVIPVGDRWLVEHTALAASPPVDPIDLRTGLVERLGAGVVEAAEAAATTETVWIPMGAGSVIGTGPVVPFGTAAGMAHPATGYSVAASLTAAGRVADAVAAGDDPHAAVWPVPARRARALHDYGLRALLRLEPDETAAFFDAFFQMPVEEWAAYLRVDTTPRAVARAMTAAFRAAPWSVRRRLLGGDPRGLVAGLLAR